MRVRQVTTPVPNIQNSFIIEWVCRHFAISTQIITNKYFSRAQKCPHPFSIISTRRNDLIKRGTFTARLVSLRLSSHQPEKTDILTSTYIPPKHTHTQYITYTASIFLFVFSFFTIFIFLILNTLFVLTQLCVVIVYVDNE